MIAILMGISCQKQTSTQPGSPSVIPNVPIQAVNERNIPEGNVTYALMGATLIDGRGGMPIPNACVIIQNNIIQAVGTVQDMEIPEGANQMDVSGLTLLPGLIDAHFHLSGEALPNLFLQHGITSLRDPGAWIESYANVRSSGEALPRLFLTGPHLDMYPPAYPQNSYLIRDVGEAKNIVNRLIDEGASAIKVYFRLSLELIREICATAHARGIPVTAHLEIVDARDAIHAGLDGIEHITSLGTAMLPLQQAETYRQAILADNNAKKAGTL